MDDVELKLFPGRLESARSVRVDLLGGTLDISPINLILPHVVTLNVATSLMAKVAFELIEDNQKNKEKNYYFEIHSLDYQQVYRFSFSELTNENIRSGHFKEMSLICELLRACLSCASSHTPSQTPFNLRIELSSKAPAGSGLGGSSAMAICFYELAWRFFYQVNLAPARLLAEVKDIEGRILDCGPTGYQDYYPAVYGGVLALSPRYGGVEVGQLFSDELKLALESQATLVYSGHSRFSAINNWDVFKGFFDRNPLIRNGLEQIANLSAQAFFAIKEKKFGNLRQLILAEGQARANIFPRLYPQAVVDLIASLQKKFQLGPSELGGKACGAGGGGCFLILAPAHCKPAIEEAVKKSEMEVLEFKIERPLF